MITNFRRDAIYVASSIDYNGLIISRIGGNIPKYFENKLESIKDYLYYATIEHPQIEGKVFSIFIPKNYAFMLKHNIYPDCSIQVITHDFSVESDIIVNTNENLARVSISNFTEIAEGNYEGNLIKMNGTLNLIQNENYYFNKLLSDGYVFFSQIDEDFYSDELLKGDYPFGYGCLYLYCKYDGEIISNIIAGFWQYS